MDNEEKMKFIEIEISRQALWFNILIATFSFWLFITNWVVIQNDILGFTSSSLFLVYLGLSVIDAIRLSRALEDAE